MSGGAGQFDGSTRTVEVVRPDSWLIDLVVNCPSRLDSSCPLAPDTSPSSSNTILSGSAVQYSGLGECFDVFDASNHPLSTARARCSATVLLSKLVAIARRRTPTRQLLPSGSINIKCAESTRRVVDGGP